MLYYTLVFVIILKYYDHKHTGLKPFFSVYCIIILIVIYLKSSKKIALKRWTYGQVQKFHPDYFYLFAQNSYSLLFVVYIAKHIVKC